MFLNCNNSMACNHWTLAVLREQGEDAYIMGEIVSGEEKVVLC